MTKRELLELIAAQSREILDCYKHQEELHAELTREAEAAEEVRHDIGRALAIKNEAQEIVDGIAEMLGVEPNECHMTAAIIRLKSAASAEPDPKAWRPRSAMPDGWGVEKLDAWHIEVREPPYTKSPPSIVHPNLLPALVAYWDKEPP